MKVLLSDAERSCRIARIAGGLGTCGVTLDTLVDLQVIRPSTTQLVAIGACATIWVLTLVLRRPSLAFGAGAFLAINAAIITALAASAQRLAESGVNWVPFRAQQLGALTVALLAPPPTWVGVLAIVGFIGAAVTQFALFAPEVRAHLPYGDPWATLFFGLFALVLLFYRRRSDERERAAARAQAEAEAYQRYARAMLALRDLANSPLQTATNLVTLLRVRAPEHADLTDKLERAVARLAALERATRPFEDRLEWQPGDEAWDPQQVLRAIGQRR